MSDAANPFSVLAELLRGLRLRFIAAGDYMADKNRLTPHTAEVLGGIAGLITHCEHVRQSIDRLESADPHGYEAFWRAVEEK